MACSGCIERRKQAARILAAARARNGGQARDAGKAFIRSAAEDLQKLRVNWKIPSMNRRA